MYRLLELAKWLELLWAGLRFAVQIARARDFAPALMLQMRSSVAPLYLPERWIVPLEVGWEPLASSRIAEQAL